MNYTDGENSKNKNPLADFFSEKFSFITENEKLSELKEKITESNVYALIQENKMLSILVLSLVVLLIILLLLISISTSKTNKKDKPYSEPLILTEPILSPKNKELDSTYTITRETKEQWEQSEAQQWFTVPSEKELDSLSKTNDKLINDILGATP